MKLAVTQKLMHWYAVVICLILTAAVEPLTAQNEIHAEIILSAEEGGPRRLEIISDNSAVHETPSVYAKKVEKLSRGTIFANLGCMEVAGQGWCKVRRFRGGGRGFLLAVQVQPAQGPDGIVPQGLNDSKRRARKHDFDAKYEIPCAQERGQVMRTCRAEVARSGGGDATVAVTFPNGFARDLYFVHGEFTRASATMSGVGTDVDWQFENEIYAIRVDDQRFELPSALVLGE